MLRKDPKMAARLVAQAAKAGIKRATRGGLMSAFSGPGGAAPCYAMQQGGRMFPAQPVVALAGVPGLYEFGALDVTSEPVPGQWYRIQRGTNLLKVAEQAWDDRGTRYKHSKWINAVKANAVYHRPTKDGFEANSYGPGIISFNPNYADDPEGAIAGDSGGSYAVIFIPEAPGDEPPEIVPDVIEPEIEPDPDPIEPDPDPTEVEPDVTPELPDEDPIEPPDPDVDVTEDDVVIPAVPTDRERCEETGGFYVPRENGWSCEQCPPGSRWDYFRMECTGPIEPDPTIPDDPAVCGCPPGTREIRHPDGSCECVPDDVVGDDCSSMGLETDPVTGGCIFPPDDPIDPIDPVDPVDPDPGDPWDPGVEPPTGTGKLPPALWLGLAAFFLGDL